MKKIIAFVLFVACILTLAAQDRITLKNGEVLSVFVLEKNDRGLRYKLANSDY
ncbi:MAG: hypothetical protein PHE04_00210 [Bacteroidales bacterium]|nr:hypothetical protein [Bacteroidales bacterium]MDD3430723.1 hypothetical protein [Bacteroidales bacterium]MDD4361003.1 hypothetical protein [Bacteroidales bacterium]MDD4431769.1 hypothetical protein [Bacteroidales bacterium]